LKVYPITLYLVLKWENSEKTNLTKGIPANPLQGSKEKALVEGLVEEILIEEAILAEEAIPAGPADSMVRRDPDLETLAAVTEEAKRDLKEGLNFLK